MKPYSEWRRLRGAPRVGLRVRVKPPGVKFADHRYEGVVRSLEGCGFVLVAPDYPDAGDAPLSLWKTHKNFLLSRAR